MSRPRIAVTHRIPPSVTPLGDWLREVRDEIVLVTTAECAELYRNDFRDIRVVPDYSGGDHVERALEELAGRGLDRIVSGTEDDVLRVARVRERHGIPGMRVDAARHFIDKHVMKSAVREAVRVPAFAAADDPPALRALRATVPPPYVVKPRRGYASRGVTVVHDADRLDHELAARDLGASMVEEFIEGRMYHVDGLMRAGQLLVCYPSAYLNTCLSFQDSTPLGSAQLDDGGLRDDLTRLAAQVVSALPHTDLTPFHLEVFGDRRGGLVFCEIACRLGGGHIMETFTHKLGTNPVRIWYRDQAGLPAEGDLGARGEPSGSAGFLLVPPRPGTVLRIDTPTLPDFVTGFTVNTDCPRTFDGASASTDEMLGFVVNGRDYTEVSQHLQLCMSIANEITHWA